MCKRTNNVVCTFYCAFGFQNRSKRQSVGFHIWVVHNPYNLLRNVLSIFCRHSALRLVHAQTHTSVQSLLRSHQVSVFQSSRSQINPVSQNGLVVNVGCLECSVWRNIIHYASATSISNKTQTCTSNQVFNFATNRTRTRKFYS